VVKFKSEEVTMLQIGDAIISLDIIEKKFCCDLNVCKGACCVHGDSGAPLTEEEMKKLNEIGHIIKTHLTPEGLNSVENQGLFLKDSEGDMVTPLNNGKECAYSFFEDGICKCVIEKLYFENKIDFRKPVSCHLYPVRIKKYKDFEAVNYDRWDICKCAVEKGEKENIDLYSFCRESFIRKYGEEWYEQLKFSAENIDKIPRV